MYPSGIIQKENNTSVSPKYSPQTFQFIVHHYEAIKALGYNLLHCE